MAGNFLQRSRHGTTYFFRRRVPDDLQHVIKFTQLFRSLATADRREAVIRARALAYRTDELFARLRHMAKKKNDSSEVGLILEIDEDEFRLPRVRLQTEPHDSAEDKQNALALVQKIAEARQASASGTAMKPGKPLSEAVDEFLGEGVKKPKTFRAYRTALLLHAIPFFGAATRVSSIDQERFAKYVKHVFADQGKAHSTKDGYINAFTSMFSWLRARYPTSTPPLTTRKLVPLKDDADAEQRGAFTLGHIRTLFENVARRRIEKPHEFWATVATAFMGCRIEELAQVNLNTDLLYEPTSKVWYLDFNEKADPDGIKRKSLKKQSSKRVVPIHSALIRHGFLEYLRVQRSEGLTRPFECGWKPWKEPKMGGHHWAHYVSRWGGRELVKLNAAGTLDRVGLKLTYFHSMRHTFTNVLAEREVGEERRAALQGQAVTGAGENAKRYLKLRHDPRILSGIVEEHLGAYAAILDQVLRESG